MRPKHFVFCIYALIAGMQNACGQSDQGLIDDAAPVSEVELHQGRLDYLALTRGKLDPSTFIVSGSHCDSLLFTSLFLAAGGDGVDLKKAKDDNGLWERHPLRDCGSTISKDMYIGLFTYFWHTKNLDEVKSLIHAGEVHNWVMGDGPAGDVVMTPNLVATLYEMRFRLGGGDGLARHLYSDKFEGKGLTGFQAHLQVLHILLRGSMLGGITGDQKDRLSDQAGRQPRNALFQAAYHRYTDGDMTGATARYRELCPEGRLPTSNDRCDDYLWQRDDTPKDWAPCPGISATYNGVDCELAASVIEGVL